MHYRLDDLLRLATDLGLVARRVSSDRVDVLLRPDCVLSFLNLEPVDDVEGTDSLVGFDGTPWHSHDFVQFAVSSSEYVELDELELITALACGDLLVVSQVRSGHLVDRWLCHRLEDLELSYMDPGEQLEVWSLPRSSP